MNETNHPARRLRHGERPTEPLTFEDDAANKATEEGELPEDVRAWIKGAVAIVKQDYRSECLKMASTEEYVQDAVHQLIEAGYRPTNLDDGDLPVLPKAVAKFGPQSSIGEKFVDTSDQMKEYAGQAIAADRASRQVANKAEVEPVAYMYEWIGTQHEFNKGRIIARMPDELGGNIDLHPESWKRIGSLYATPPATTGASTARDQAFEEAASICDKKYEVRAASGHAREASAYRNCAVQIRALKGSVGASTVLTDERIERDFLNHWDSVSHDYGVNREFDTAYIAARAAWFAREVAAQAGQVAVPDALLDEIEHAIGGYSGGPFDEIQAIVDRNRANPNCGACPGDGTICKGSCRVANESPDLPAKESK